MDWTMLKIREFYHHLKSPLTHSKGFRPYGSSSKNFGEIRLADLLLFLALFIF